MKLIVFTIFLILAFVATQTKLIYMSTVFRHGARYPINNIYDGKQTAPFHGNLTGVGLRQHYLLGNYIKSDYIDNKQIGLLRQTLKPRELQIFTLTDETRCMQSAYAHALGLFPFSIGQKIDPQIDASLLEPPFETIFPSHLVSEDSPSDYALDKGFQPVPIRYADQFFPKCKNEAQIFAKRGQATAKQLAELQVQFSLFTEQMVKIFNLPVTQANLGGLVALYDTLACDNYLGRPMPSQFTDKDYQTLMFLHRYLFSLVYEDEPSRIFNAPYVHALLSNMELAIQGNLGVKKLSIYSGHDINVVPLMVFFNLTSAECLKRQWMNQTVVGNCAVPIPFASNLFFQLHQDDKNSSNYFVKARYNGNYFNLCGKNSSECAFTEFAQKSRAYLMDFEKGCGKTENTKSEAVKEITKISTIVKSLFSSTKSSSLELFQKGDQLLKEILKNLNLSF